MEPGCTEDESPKAGFHAAGGTVFCSLFEPFSRAAGYVSESADLVAGFFDTFNNDAQQASGAIGWLPSVILAQWADETGYGESLSSAEAHWNFAGVSIGGGVNHFADETAGLDAYIQTANLSYYDGVRAANGWQAQCVALGQSPWAASKYDGKDYDAGKTLDPGVDLIAIVLQYNLTQYDPPGGQVGVTNFFGGTPSASNPLGLTVPAGTNPPISSLGRTIPEPPAGFASSITKDSFIINGVSMTVDLSAALINASIDLDITKASTLQLTLHDPSRALANAPAFTQSSILNLDGSLWQLVAAEKQGSVMTATFEPWVVQALRSATGAYTIAPGAMTRTRFASFLVSQVTGAGFTGAPQSWIAAHLGDDAATLEQLSRGTIDNPLEDSWTALQRLSAEIQWRCYEVNGTVTFAPDAWLMSLPPAMSIVEFANGIQTIDGTFDIGQPLSTLTVNCVAGSWYPVPGQVVSVTGLGLFTGNWLVTTISRASLFQADVVVTLQQPQQALAEPKGGGAAAAVNPGQTGADVGPQPSAATANVFWPVDRSSMTVERTDQGKDWGGAGNIYAVANGTITNLYNSGWPGGTFMTLALDSPPDSLHVMVYYAEDITPSVTIGQHVNGGDVIGHAQGGPDGVEIGWADPGAIGDSLNDKLNGVYSGSGPTPEGTSFLQWITTGVL